MSHGKNIYVLQGVLRTSDKDVLFLYKFTRRIVMSTWQATISTITKFMQENPSIDIAILSTIISLNSYRISKRTYSKSLPHVFETYFLTNFYNMTTDPKFVSQIKLENNGDGTVFWGLVFFKSRTTGKIYQSQPFMNLKSGEIAEVTVVDNPSNTRTYRYKFNNSVPPWLEKRLPNLFFSWNEFVCYVYFYDIYRNSYYFKTSEHSLTKTPHLPKKISKFNPYHFFKKRHFIKKAFKDGTSYERIMAHELIVVPKINNKLDASKSNSHLPKNGVKIIQKDTR